MWLQGHVLLWGEAGQSRLTGSDAAHWHPRTPASPRSCLLSPSPEGTPDGSEETFEGCPGRTSDRAEPRVTVYPEDCLCSPPGHTHRWAHLTARQMPPRTAQHPYPNAEQPYVAGGLDPAGLTPDGLRKQPARSKAPAPQLLRHQRSGFSAPFCFSSLKPIAVPHHRLPRARQPINQPRRQPIHSGKRNLHFPSLGAADACAPWPGPFQAPGPGQVVPHHSWSHGHLCPSTCPALHFLPFVGRGPRGMNMSALDKARPPVSRALTHLRLGH